jgi:hypothetical protein
LAQSSNGPKNDEQMSSRLEEMTLQPRPLEADNPYITSILLRMRRRGPLSASWTRRILGHFAEKHAESLRLAVATTLVQQNEGYAGAVKRVVFYIDNHLRPYTGKHKIRKGWRMQTKRAGDC